jgi:hypothetical protein
MVDSSPAMTWAEGVNAPGAFRLPTRPRAAQTVAAAAAAA